MAKVTKTNANKMNTVAEQAAAAEAKRGAKSFAVARTRAARLEKKVYTDSPAVKVLAPMHYKAGSYRAAAWQHLTTCRTVAEYLKGGFKPHYVKRWVDAKAIQLG